MFTHTPCLLFNVLVENSYLVLASVVELGIKGIKIIVALLSVLQITAPQLFLSNFTIRNCTINLLNYIHISYTNLPHIHSQVYIFR